jgi:hypothetical protein
MLAIAELELKNSCATNAAPSEGELRRKTASCTLYTILKRFSAAQARQQFSEVLDCAEKGEAVVVERRGVRFRLHLEKANRRSEHRAPVVELLDPAVVSGNWTWKWGPKAVRFSARKKRRRP